MNKSFTIIVLSAAATLLAGCNGSNNNNQGNPPVISYTPLADTTATQASPLSGGGVDTVSGGIQLVSGGTLDHANKRWSLSGDTGTIDFAAGNGTIDSGGSLTVFGQEMYVAGVVSQATGANTALTYVGVPTIGADMVSAPATATYNGGSKVLITDAGSSYALDGSASATMDFVAGSGSAVIDNLNGTRADLNGSTTAVTNVATLGINNLSINGIGFSGSQMNVTSGQLSQLPTASATVDVQGGFYGPGALNVGGVLSLMDTTAGSLSIQGAFTGTR